VTAAMMKVDRKTLFTGLAFLAVMIKSPERSPSGTSARKIRRLAGLMETFSVEHNGAPASGNAEARDTRMDALIERQIAELRNTEETELPTDRQTLMDMHDRLQHRKSRRLCREFYGTASEDGLADAVLTLLDEEIEDVRSLV
jgi:hypothetical protein